MDGISELLSDYYSGKKFLIGKSIESIIPPVCSAESMRHIAGTVDFGWDLSTLQKNFFDILLKYLDKGEKKILCLDICIFLEAAGKDPEKFIPVLGIPAFFETSNEIFRNITKWTNGDEKISGTDIPLEGNVSIALLTLPSHNLLFHRLDIDPEKLVKLYESYTTNIFNSLFGNGIKLFREQSGKIPRDLAQYYCSITLHNKGSLKFASDLWLIFNRNKYNDTVAAALNTFVEDRTAAIQLERDLISFERLQGEQDKNNTYHFNPLSNFLYIHAANTLGDITIPQKKLSCEYIVDRILRSGSHIYANNQINKLKSSSESCLRVIPMDRRYKELLESYCDYLVHK